MNDKSKRAKELFLSGHNCAQAVLLAFCDDLKIDEETAMLVSSSFGGGMGRMREVCGAVSGMFMVAGLKCGPLDPKDSKAKEEHYRLIQQLAADFKKETGSIICREMLGLGKDCNTDPKPQPRTQQYYKKRPCAELVELAAKIAQETLYKQQS